MAILLLKPEIDVWKPAAHSGTFRGNNLAFVTGKAALDLYWADGAFMADVNRMVEAQRKQRPSADAIRPR